MLTCIIYKLKDGYIAEIINSKREAIASSGVYMALHTCENGIERIRAYAPSASVEDQTIPDCQRQKHPKFEMREHAGMFFFRLKSKNAQILAYSNGYKSKDACIGAIEDIKKNIGETKIEYLLD